MSTAAVIGSTGLVGSHILATLLASEAFATVSTLSRRPPKAEGAKLHAVVEPDSSAWAGQLGALPGQPPAAVFSALGTTRADAGGIANQWKIDHDLNVELARAAKAAGVGTYVFVSSGGTRGLVAGAAPYSKMKVGVEDAVAGLGFDQSIVLRPGLLLGDREKPKTALLNSIAYGLGRLHRGLQDAWAQEGEVVARAAVHAAVLAAQGKAPSKHWVLEAADIVRLGDKEWKGV